MFGNSEHALVSSTGRLDTGWCLDDVGKHQDPEWCDGAHQHPVLTDSCTACALKTPNLKQLSGKARLCKQYIRTPEKVCVVCNLSPTLAVCMSARTFRAEVLLINLLLACPMFTSPLLSHIAGYSGKCEWHHGRSHGHSTLLAAQPDSTHTLVLVVLPTGLDGHVTTLLPLTNSTVPDMFTQQMWCGPATISGLRSVCWCPIVP